MTGHNAQRRSGPPGSPDRLFNMFRGITRSLYTTHAILPLLRQTCEHLVRRGGFAFAWIGTDENDASHRIRPCAWLGSATGYLDQVDTICRLPPDERDPTVAAFCNGELAVEADLDARRSPDDRPSILSRYGLAAGVGISLKQDGRLHGAIGIYSSNRASFDQDSIRLLRELAEAVAFGISRFRLQQELDGLHSLLSGHSQDVSRLPVQVGNAVMLLDPDEIYYAQADGHYTRLCGRGQEFFCHHSLKWVADQLPTKRFLRVHRSYIVNTRHVRALQSDNRRTWLSFAETSCDPVPVSRGQTSSVRHALGVESVPAVND